MTKFRKRPITVEAFQWLGQPKVHRPKWAQPPMVINTALNMLSIVTLEGIMTCHRGDWIIQGVKGEIYPCKPDIFLETYEAVDD